MKQNDEIFEAMDYIDEDLIESTENMRAALLEKAAKKKKYGFSKIIFSKPMRALAACLILAVGISTGVLHSIRNAQTSIWTTVSNADGKIEKTGTNAAGVEVTFLADVAYAPTVSGNDELVAEMLGQWVTSVVTYDYDMHYALFQGGFVYEGYTSKIQRMGMNYEQAIANSAKVVKDSCGFDFIIFSYTLAENEQMTTEELWAFFCEHGYDYDFERFGLDVNKITAARRCTITDISMYANNAVYISNRVREGNDFVFYCYEGVWYMAPNKMDSQVSVALAGAELGDDSGYYNKKTKVGTITSMENGYIIFGTSNYYCYTEAEYPADLAVGDEVEIVYYTMGNIGYEKTTRRRVFIATAQKITRVKN